MTKERTTGYFARLIAAVLNRPLDQPPAATAPEDDTAALRAEIGSLKLDVEERDERIATMRKEYEQLQASTAQATDSAGDARLEKVLKRLAGPLSNLACLQSAHRAGEQVEASDFVDLVSTLEKELARVGLVPIGQVADRASFDPSLHQRMSGGAVRDGEEVTIRLPGYRFADKVLSKALVSAKE